LLKSNHGKTALVALLVLLAVFVYGMLRLVVMRFEVGDVYPAYSSLRADPLGTKAFYEGMDNLHGVSVSRNYRPLARLGEGQTGTVFFFGVPLWGLFRTDENTVGSLEAWVKRGGRLVISIYPEAKRPKRPNKKDAEKETGEKIEEGGEEDTDKQHEKERKKTIRMDSLLERWGVGLDMKGSSPGHDGRGFTAGLVSDEYALPDELSWYSMLYFKDMDSAWDTIYASEELPVFIERKLGAGTVVISTDSYFASNEAMRRERHPALLAWLVGPNGTVVFDETHLGIKENPGVVSLGRKYRLHGLFAGIIILALLFVWKNSSSLVPPHEGDLMVEEGGLAAGNDYTSGAVSLLRRNIPARDVLGVCLEEWKRAFPRKQKKLSEKIGQAQAVLESESRLPRKQRNEVKAYRSICEILSERKHI
jgi:hypothetical protein